MCFIIYLFLIFDMFLAIIYLALTFFYFSFNILNFNFFFSILFQLDAKATLLDFKMLISLFFI